MNELFRIVDENDQVYSGYTNTYGVYRNKAKAELFAVQELSRMARNRKAWAALGSEVKPLPILRVQRTAINWEDA